MLKKVDHKMASSTICQKFSQNAWRKDLCSNCFKSKEEHRVTKSGTTDKKTDSPKIKEAPAKGIIKSSSSTKSKKFKVNFPKVLAQVIGYGGEWSDADESDDDKDFDSSNNLDDNSSSDDENNLEIKRLTKSNTAYNTNNGNLLGDPEENIKKSFYALRLGTPQVGSDGKKQTLKINVTPFGTPSKLSCMKAKFELNKAENQYKLNNTVVLTKKDNRNAPSIVSATSKKSNANKENSDDGKSSPPIERAMEKSLLEEISETLEKNQKKNLANPTNSLKIQSDKDGKVKFEINSVSNSSVVKTNGTGELKKSIVRNSPITKDHVKPKINVFPKNSTATDSSDSNNSDNENGLSAYYDIVEPTGYENVPDGESKTESNINNSTKDKSVYSSCQYITDMMLSSRTKAASYSLPEGNFVTSKITSDGLIVTKCASDDALDSTGSSFEGSSDEETSYNMNRSESDSGIGVSLTSEHNKSPKDKEKQLSVSTNNSDYEDIQVVETDSSVEKNLTQFSAEKSRELAGEPDGSADPDGKNACEAPELPKSPPPTKPSVESRSSFLHGVQKTTAIIKKPEVPAKPIVNLKKAIIKRPTITNDTEVELQQNSKDITISSNVKKGMDDLKFLKKGRAPNPPNNDYSPPPTPEKDYDMKMKSELKSISEIDVKNANKEIEKKTSSITLNLVNPVQKNDDDVHSNIYTRNSLIHNTNNVKTSPVIREKDKRERAIINPKFRSLNTFTQRKQQQHAIMSVMAATSPNLLAKSSGSETRNKLSMSEECIAGSCEAEKKRKNKFSIKKFLRMGTSKTTDNLQKKNGIYSEIVTGDDIGVIGKPRLVIIHPIDINPTAVEVLKDCSNSNISKPEIKSNCVKEDRCESHVIGKPPAPPQRTSNLNGNNDDNKPVRPPPPKSAELRRKQKNGFKINKPGGSVKNKSDNVYANLGEIRSAIAPRKPERTASMREREAQLELARKRNNNDSSDTLSICSSNRGSVSEGYSAKLDQSVIKEKQLESIPAPTLTAITTNINTYGSTKTVLADSDFSTFERKKAIEDAAKLKSNTLESIKSNKSASNKLEIFEKVNLSESTKIKLNDGLKDSVRKINSTIDSYLKDKRDYESLYEASGTTANGTIKNFPPPTPLRNKTSTLGTNTSIVTGETVTDLRKNVDILSVGVNSATNRNQILRSSYQDNHFYSGNNHVVRSEYGFGNNRTYNGVHNNLTNIPRTMSASYCGSEMGESDIYSPYSFYGSEAGADVASDMLDNGWGVVPSAKPRINTTNRLRMRKGRSVVHKNIEDNYSAVVVANHEALAQVLDQLQQTPIIPIQLRPLASAMNLRFDDFTIIEGVQAFVVGKRAFHAATWNQASVTLALSADCNQISGVSGELNQLSGGISGVLNPITEFCDLVPSYNLPLMPSTEVHMIQSTISVLPRMHLDTLQSIGTILKNKTQIMDKNMSNFRGSIPNLSGNQTNEKLSTIRNVCSVQNLSTLNEENGDKSEDLVPVPGISLFDDVMCREIGFIMLQLLNGLKNLQAKAIEEIPLSLSNVVLCREFDNKDAQSRLCVLQGFNSDEEEQMGPLCKCAHNALVDMLPQTKITQIISKILLQERSESLSKAKTVLEFVLWGPCDVQLIGTTKERELALQRWLDLERATVLHGLVRTRVELTIYDECHLMFLVRSSAKIMNEAAKIVGNFKQNSEI